VFEALQHPHHFGRQPTMQSGVLLEQRQRVSYLSRRLFGGLLGWSGERKRIHPRFQERSRLGALRLVHTKAAHDDAFGGIHEDLHGATGHPAGLLQSCAHANAIQIVPRRQSDLGITLRHQQQFARVFEGLGHCRERSGAADEQRHGDVGEQHNVAKRKDRQPVAAGP